MRNPIIILSEKITKKLKEDINDRQKRLWKTLEFHLSDFVTVGGIGTIVKSSGVYEWGMGVFYYQLGRDLDNLAHWGYLEKTFMRTQSGYMSRAYRLGWRRIEND